MIGSGPHRYHAIVVGGGPAGALLAYLLAKYGVPVLLIERQHDFSREFRGEGLSPSGQAMFREVGLWEEFDDLPHTEFERAEFFYKGKRLGEVIFDWQDFDYHPRFVSQPSMLEMLVGEASRYQTFSFLRGARVLEPLLDGERITGVRVSGQDGEHKISADYVFAADGRFSTLRKLTALDEPRNPQFFDVVWCKIDEPSFYQDEPATVRGFFGNGHLGLFIPSYDGKLQVGWLIRKGSYKQFREMGIAGWMEEMAKHVNPPMAEHLRSQKGKAIHPFLLDVVCDHYPRWSVPGMLLIGDAAHPMSPVGAQGINIALRDAVIAANHFIPLLKRGKVGVDLDKAAKRFEKERREEVLKIQKLQARPPVILFGKGWLTDFTIGLVKFLSKIGLLKVFTLFNNPARNPFVVGVTKVELKLPSEQSNS